MGLQRVSSGVVWSRRTVAKETKVGERSGERRSAMQQQLVSDRRFEQ
jgi:hypothetical protein